MPNEITVSGSVRISKGSMEFSRRMSSTLTMVGDALMHSVQLIGDTHEPLVMGDVTVPGAFLFINLSTFDIQIGKDVLGSFVSSFKIPVDGFVMGSNLDIAAPYAKCSDSEGGYLESAISQV